MACEGHRLIVYGNRRPDSQRVQVAESGEEQICVVDDRHALLVGSNIGQQRI